MATRIGCDNLVYAVQKTDSATARPTYNAIKSAVGVMSLNINPNSNLATLFCDDGPSENAVSLGNIEVEIQKNALTTTQKADLLGHEIDANGGLVYGANDVAPWVAIGFRTLKSNGKYRYVWLYKGKFMEPEESSETKGDNVNFQADTIKGQFVKLDRRFTVNGKSKAVWKYEVDAETASVNTDLLADWFRKVQLLDQGSISGVVTESAGSTPLGGVLVTADTSETTITAAVTGAYKLTNVTPGTRTLTFSKTSYTSGTIADIAVAEYAAVVDKNITLTLA